MKTKIPKFLFGREGAATINQIRAVGLVSGTRGSVSKCVTRLKREGFVECVDAQSVPPYYRLTSSGRDQCEALSRHTSETVASATATANT